MQHLSLTSSPLGFGQRHWASTTRNGTANMQTAHCAQLTRYHTVGCHVTSFDGDHRVCQVLEQYTLPVVCLGEPICDNNADAECRLQLQCGRGAEQPCKDCTAHCFSAQYETKDGSAFYVLAESGLVQWMQPRTREFQCMHRLHPAERRSRPPRRGSSPECISE